jgi:hypothetical protein
MDTAITGRYELYIAVAQKGFSKYIFSPFVKRSALCLEESPVLVPFEGPSKNFDPKSLEFRARRFCRLVSRDLPINSSGGSHDFHIIKRAEADPADPSEPHLPI